MTHRMRSTWIAAAAALALLPAAGAPPVGASPEADEPAGDRSPAALYARECAQCHQAPDDARTPDRAALSRLTGMGILMALETGSMRSQATSLSYKERRAMALYLSSRATTPEQAQHGSCREGGAPRDLDVGPRWTGFGGRPGNTRAQTDAGSAERLAPAKVAGLRVEWAFGFPGANTANGALVAAGGRLFVGSQDGRVYALDLASGCSHWTFQADAWVRTAPAIEARGDGHALFFGDSLATAYAVDAADGRLLWKREVDEEGVITGSPQVHGGRVFMPVSAGAEVPRAADPGYECCRLRGSVVALDSATGEILWKTHTTEESRPTVKNAQGTQMFGPSGAPVWSSVTLDPGRGALYVGTGENYSPPATATSDAVLALDMQSGEIRWSRQFTAGDVWQSACSRAGGLEGNCPFTPGPDADVGATPILHTLPDARELVIVGEKSGRVHALDPDRAGALVWSTRVGRGGMQGGIHWGIAAHADSVYATVADHVEIVRRIPGRIVTRSDPEAGALVALDGATGELRWKTPAARGTCDGREGCYASLSAAPAVAAGAVVFAGSLDGHLRAYAAEDGRVLWDFDTVRAFETTNGVEAHGGAIDGSGPIVVDGRVYVNSGYGRFGQLPGNVLAAFSID